MLARISDRCLRVNGNVCLIRQSFDEQYPRGWVHSNFYYLGTDAETDTRMSLSFPNNNNSQGQATLATTPPRISCLV